MNNTAVINKKRMYTRKMTTIAMFSGISYVLAFFKFPVPLSPSFARMDLSDLPALVGAFAFGPMVGIMVELLKNLLQLLSTSTAWLAIILSSIVMGIMAAITNYYILLPAFEQFIPMEQLSASFGKFIPFIETKLDVVLFNAFPFNVIKGFVVGLITMLTYKRLSPFLKGIK